MTTTYSNKYRGVDVHYYNGSGNPCHSAKINDSVEVDFYTTGEYLLNGTTTCDLIQSDVFVLGILQAAQVISNVVYDDTATTNPSFHFPMSGCPRP